MKLTRIYTLLIGLSIFLPAPAVSPKQLRSTTDQGIEYITGGISTDEVEVMNTHIDSFSLRLLFSEGVRGRSITGVNVIVYDNRQNVVFRLSDAKPQLFVNLPKGTYYVQGDYNGGKQGHRFKLKESDHKKVVLNWKNSIEEDTLENGNGEDQTPSAETLAPSN